MGRGAAAAVGGGARRGGRSVRAVDFWTFGSANELARCSTSCKEISISHAYHVICGDCAKASGKCAKCLKISKAVEAFGDGINEQSRQAELDYTLSRMQERKRRAVQRLVESDGMSVAEAIQVVNKGAAETAKVRGTKTTDRGEEEGEEKEKDKDMDDASGDAEDDVENDAEE